MNKFLFFFLVLCHSYTLSAQDNKSGKFSRYGLVMDQDIFVELFGLKNEDRNYTMGLGLFWTNERWGEAKFFKPFRWLSEKTYRGWSKALFKTDLYERTRSATLSFGMTGFTPLYLGDNIVDSLYYIVNDRPFSSLTFLSIKHQTGTPKKVETNQLVLGLLGLGIGREVQSHIHENHWFGSTRQIPTGWKYQLHNGGRPTGMFSNRADILLNDVASFRPERLNNINTQFIASREYRVGYYNSVSAGIAMRIGLLDPNNWTSYDTYQLGFASNKKIPMAKTIPPEATDVNMIKAAALTTTDKKIEKALREVQTPRELYKEFYFQASLRPLLMIYNQHLNKKGNAFNYSYHINHFIVEGLAGVGATIPNARKNFSVNIFMYLSARTAEIRSSVSDRTHLWGGAQLSFTRIKP